MTKISLTVELEEVAFWNRHVVERCEFLAVLVTVGVMISAGDGKLAGADESLFQLKHFMTFLRLFLAMRERNFS